jgi:hypothetical protein
VKRLRWCMFTTVGTLGLASFFILFWDFLHLEQSQLALLVDQTPRASTIIGVGSRFRALKETWRKDKDSSGSANDEPSDLLSMAPIDRNNTSTLLKRLSRYSNRCLPDFLVIGTQKGGTVNAIPHVRM